MSDDTIIGLKTNCNNIRMSAGAVHYDEKKAMVMAGKNHCRKVQLGHTGYRLMWTSGWMIPVIALKLKQISDEKSLGFSHLTCLWLAYKFKMYASNSYSEYGDLFQANAGYLSDACLVQRFFDKNLNNYVMQHFDEEQNPMASELGLSRMSSTDQEFVREVFEGKGYSGSSNSTVNTIFDLLSKDENLARLVAYVGKAKNAVNSTFTQIKFKFEKSLFKSTVTGVCYEGILKPESKLNRVLFKDEENSVLSVIRTSKFITELK